MTTERLSKLQKWILVNCYEKVEKKDNSKLTILQDWSYRNSELNKHYWSYLFRAEILLDFFKCSPDKYKQTYQRLQHFTGKNNKEQVILTNSLRNLQKKELINVMDGVYSRWQGLFLTDKGKELALKLILERNKLNVNNKELIISQ